MALGGVMFDWTLVNGQGRWRSWLSMWKNNIIEMEMLESSNCVQDVANSLV